MRLSSDIHLFQVWLHCSDKISNVTRRPSCLFQFIRPSDMKAITMEKWKWKQLALNLWLLPVWVITKLKVSSRTDLTFAASFRNQLERPAHQSSGKCALRIDWQTIWRVADELFWAIRNTFCSQGFHYWMDSQPLFGLEKLFESLKEFKKHRMVCQFWIMVWLKFTKCRFFSRNTMSP